MDIDTPSPAHFQPIARNVPWVNGLTIRAQKRSDAPEIAALQSLPGYRYGTLQMPYPRLADVEKELDGSTPGQVLLVGFLDGVLVAHAGFSRYSGRRSHTAGLGIGVHDAYTGRGIGQALLAELLAIADDWMDVRRMELTVIADNAAAVRLYEKAGFMIEGTLKAYVYRDGEYVDAYAMARLRKASSS
ncbi:GNAT family N-acetyltransferase [Labrenzia sp. PHM005]|uniref:GNAT family N-acetyltransferase n=1 Tax=Labrenzia sp. PHM005 TaxID=2590016 RepID=UPI00113FC98E|nr:GNAT family N-acetyltransferase [Labrenzia sp. PHM005]QDG78366.1 GNAT family N-acetyltransferase [Labrenzia sp. PHM005]